MHSRPIPHLPRQRNPRHAARRQYVSARGRKTSINPQRTSERSVTINTGKIVKYPGPRRPIDSLYQLFPVSPRNPVPTHIEAPPYVSSHTQPIFEPNAPPPIQTPSEIDTMREACLLAGYIRRFAGNLVRPGITTDEIDRVTHDEIIRLGAYPSPLGYHNFPKSLCSSVNNVVCHGIPDARVLQEGDIINLDITVYFKGFHGDCSATFGVGAISLENEQLIQTTRLSMNEAIALCAPGIPFAAIGNHVQEVADRYKYGTVPSFCGHGIARDFHTAPTIIHAANNVPGEMQTGMTFTIEPMLNQTIYGDFIVHRDGWTAVNASGDNSAQFEETIVVTDSGAEILTRCNDDQFRLLAGSDVSDDIIQRALAAKQPDVFSSPQVTTM